MYLSRRNILLIGGDEMRCRPMVRSLRLLCSVRSRALHTSANLPPELPDVVVVSGIALKGERTMAQIQRALHPFLERDIPILCMLEEPSIRGDVQNRSMGAVAVLPAAAPLRVVADALRDLTRRGSPSRRLARMAALEAVVQDVSLILADLMNAAAGGSNVSAAVTKEASRLLLETVRVGNVDRWMSTVSHIHDTTYRHCMLMAGIMAAFVLSIGFRPNDCIQLIQAAVLHDIGKALIPIEILNKPSRLTAVEMATIREHPGLGYELLQAQGDHHPTTLKVVRHHHEYLDGSGYPLGLKGLEIDDPVRIATICDVFTALIEKRAYKPALPSAEAFSRMTPMRGQLDPDLLARFGHMFVPATATGHGG